MLSRRFGSWDDITPNERTKQRHLCLPCGWAYRDKQLQYHPTILSEGAQRLRHPNGTELRAFLSRPIPSTAIVLFPVSGKKAVAPGARRGKITTDHGHFTWTRRHAQAVKDLMELKATGIPEGALLDPAPPGHVLDKLPPDTFTATQEAWARLTPARQDKALFPALVKMTREKM